MRSERIDRKDIILISIDLTGEEINLNQICRRWGITEKTLFKYFNEMNRSGQIQFRRTDSETFIRLTDSGRNELKVVYDIISGIILDPKTSGFAKKVNLNMILDHLKNPYEKLEFLDRFFLKKESNATSLIDEIKGMRSDSRFSRYIEEVLSIDGDNDVGFLEETLKSTSLYSEYCIDHGFTLTNTDINSLIIEAELLRRRGDIGEAMCIYTGILQRKTGIETGKWMIAIAGMAQCQVYLNREIEAMKFLDNMKSSMNDPVERGFMDKLEADILQDLDRFEESSGLYRSCLGVFQENEFPLIRLTILNNLGVQYCRKENMKIATDFWEEALKISKKVSLPYVEAIISLNLADAYAQKKRFYKAEELLRNAAKVLQSVGDLEGLSGVDFNKSLVFIEKGEKKKALKYFEKAMKFPLTYKRKREERRRVFKGRMRAKGLL